MLPAIFTWRDGVMIPIDRYRNLCRKQYHEGEEYPLEVVEHRSMASHNQYFAAVEEGYRNLAEEFSGKFPSAEHLRHWALIETGFATETDYPCDDERDAKAFARGFRKSDEYAVIRRRGDVVKVFSAKSQSRGSMRKRPFEDSKKAVLDLIATMSRTTQAELKKNAGRSA